MEKKIENPPAFPTVVDKRHHQELDTIPGMTLRDYFAAKAMQACLSTEQDINTRDEVARYAYLIADAMLAERSKP